MERNEFLEQYKKILKEAMCFSYKGRREGLLVLENLLDNDRVSNRDIFMYGMRFSVDGTDCELIDKILSNIINQEKDEYERILKTIQKEAVLSIQKGDNTRILYSIINSYTDIQYSEEELVKMTDLIERVDISEKIRSYIYEIAKDGDYKDYKKFSVEVSPFYRDYSIPESYSIEIKLHHNELRSISSVQCSIGCDGTSSWHTVESHNDDLDCAGERVRKLMPFIKEIISKACEMVKRESAEAVKGAQAD
jgi:hypothetical protein